MEKEITNPNQSKINQAYFYFYFIFFIIVAVVVSIWANFYLDSIGFDGQESLKSLTWAGIIFGGLILLMVVNYLIDKKIFMKGFEQGDLRFLKINFIVYLVFVVLVLIALPFLLKLERLGIGIIIFGILFGYGIMQMMFYFLRYREVKRGF